MSAAPAAPAAPETPLAPVAGGDGAPLHVPVLLEEVILALAPQPGQVIIDATLGAGGYTRALLDRGVLVHAFDRDPDAIAGVRGWPEASACPPRLVLHHRPFSQMAEAMAQAGVTAVDAVVMDIGVSSMQLDRPERGFAFGTDGPLDMTMDRTRPNAADFLNEAPEAAIADVLYRFGEERQSRRVARAIVAARPLATTGQLAQVIRRALGFVRHTGRGPAPKDPATRSFQAIRIHVNGELDELAAALAGAQGLLREGGRLAVVSFHSLEDRIVKTFLREASGQGARASRHLPEDPAALPPRFTNVARAIRPGEAEIARNPRARSATLRSAMRTITPVQGQPARKAM